MSVPEIEGFEIIEKLGEGGMAVVWKARQVSLDRIVAVKMLSSQLRGENSDVDRFQTEARSAAKLKHPGIVQVHDAGARNGRCYFVMEYVAGYTVGDWIRRKGRISEEEALVVAECVADALNYAWTTAGMIHCDIKPDNVMIDDDGTVKVADLGLARTINTIGSETMADEVMGTPAYISPEQAEGKLDLDCRADIYSLGAMLYHMLTGKLMFQGQPEEKVMELQVTSDAVDPKQLNPSLADETCQLLAAMLAKDPASRPQSWDDVIRELGAVRRALESRAAGTGARHPVKKITVDHDRLSRMATARTQSGGPSATWPRLTLLLGGVAVIAVLAFVLYRRIEEIPPAEPPPSGRLESPARQDAVRADATRQTVPVSGPTGAAVAPEDHGVAVAAVLPVGATNPPANAVSEPVGDPAAEMLEFARNWAQEHPEQLQEAIRRYARVAEDTRGTKYSLMAEEEIDGLEKKVRDHVAQVMERLGEQARPLVEEGQLPGAASVYEGYQGPYDAESRAERMEAANSLRKRHRESLMGDVLAKRQSERKVRGALSELGEKLVTEGVAASLALAGELVGDPVLAPDRNELQKVADLLRKAAAVDQRILESFKVQKDTEISVELTQGRRTLSIVDVKGDRIMACQMVKMDAGFASSDVFFSLADLSPRERMSRMGADTDPEVALVKGLMAFRAKSYLHARKYFETVGEPLARELLALVDREEGIPAAVVGPPRPE